MIIPIAVISPLCLVSFVLLFYQYWRINPNRRLLNLQFGLMAACFALQVARIALPRFTRDLSLPSMIMLALALLLFCLTLYLFRYLPPK